MTRNVELIFKITDQATTQLKGIRKELEALQALQGGYQQTRQQAGEAGEQAVKTSKPWMDALSKIGAAVKAVGGAYLGVKQAIGDALSVGQGFYNALLASNEALNQQVISTAANIVSTQRVLKDGVAIEDPGKAIEALQPKIREVLKQVQEDSIELVGITSQQLNGVFQILASNVNKFSGQSKQITDPLEAAGALTTDFAAALGGVGLPLEQAGQELTSLLNGAANSDSMLSRQLFGSASRANEMINKWKAQGILVDELRKKLEAFSVANAMNQRSVSGAIANIFDSINLVAMAAGEPILEPFVDILKTIESFALANKDRLSELAKIVTEQVAVAFVKIREALAPITGNIVETLNNLLPLIANTAAAWLKTTLIPAVEILGQMLNLVQPIFGAIQGISSLLAGSLNIQLGETGNWIDAISKTLNLFMPQLGPSMLDIANAMQGVAGAIEFVSGKVEELAARADDPRIEKILKVIEFFRNTSSVGLGPLKLLGEAATKGQEKNFTALSDRTQELTEESKEYADQLAELNTIAQENGGLTADQAAQRQSLLEQSKATVEGLDEQIRALKLLNPAELTPGEREKNKQTIEDLQEIRDTLADTDAGSTEVVAANIEQLGTSAQQLDKNLNNALNQLRNPTDATQLQLAAKNTVAAVQASVEAGQISAEDGLAILQEVASNAGVELATQQAAQKQISAIVQSESKLRQDAIAQEITDVKQQAETGAISRIDAERQVTALTKEQINERLTALQAEIAAAEARGEDGSRIEALRTQEAGLINELETLEIDSAKRLTQLAIDESDKKVQALALELKKQEALLLKGEITRSEFEQRATDNAIQQTEARIRGVEAALETAAGSERRKLVQQLQELNLERERLAIEGAQKVQAAQLRELENAQDKALDQIRIAESQRITELERLRLKEPELAARIDRQIADQRKAGTQEALRLEQERLAFLESQGALTGEAEIQRQDQIRAARQKVADLTGQLVQQEAAAQRALTAELNNEIDKRTSKITQALQAQTQEYEKQLELIRLASQAENTRLELLNAQKSLVSSRAALEQTVFNIAIAAANDEQKKARLQEKAGQAKLAAKVRELEIDAQIFEIQEIQRKLELESEKIQARIAQIKSRAALAEAQANAAKILADPAATKEQKAAALLGVQAAQIGVVGADASAQLTDFKAETNDALSGLKREAFNNQQQNELLNAQFEAAQSIADPGRRDRTLDQLSRSAQQSTGVNANANVTVVGGGPMSQSQGSPIMQGITAGFDQLFGGITEQIDGMLKGFNVAFDGLGQFDPNALGQTQSTSVSQNNIQIGQVNFTNRIERDNDRAQLDGVRQAIANDLSQLFNQAATAA